jgi:hypothetical protein
MLKSHSCVWYSRYSEPNPDFFGEIQLVRVLITLVSILITRIRAEITIRVNKSLLCVLKSQMGVS